MKHPLIVSSLIILASALDFVDVNNVNLADDDVRRYYFCGNSFWDAIAKCGTWCPNDDDNECPDGEECFADTYCKYTADLDATPSATVPTATATIIAATTTLAAITVATTTAATTNAATTTDVYTNTIVNSEPTQQPSGLSIETDQPSLQIATDEEEDWSQLDQVGNSSAEEEDWSHITETQNLYCGKSQFDAIRNCGRSSMKCENGVCQSGLKCFAISSSCGDGNEAEDAIGTVSTLANEDEDWSEHTETTSTFISTSNYIAGSPLPTNEPVGYDYSSSDNNVFSSPTIPPVPTASNSSPPFPIPEVPSENDVTDTLFCGYTLQDASTACHKRCRSGSPGECPAGETCFRGVECISENPRPPPTHKPTQPSTSEPTTASTDAQLQNLCATDYGELVETCYSATVCDSTNPCPLNQTCFENIDCSVTSYTVSRSPTISQAPSSLADMKMKQNYCAMNEIDLYSNCDTMPTCNDGDPPCPLGTLCFGDHLCSSENSLVPTQHESQVPSQAPVPDNIHQPTTSRPVVLVPEPSLSDPQLLCASDISELEASCSTAESCNDGPCPKGTFCFPFACQSSAAKEPIVSGGKTYYCAQHENELKECCGMLTQCNNGLPSCSKGLSCFEYDCQQSIDLCPLNYVGWQTSRGCQEYYECEHGVAGAINACPDGMKFDKMRGECGDASLLDEHCYGPAIPKPTPRPTGPPINLCPQDVDGWHTSPDCKEYYKCQDGEASAIQVCDEGLLFDKTRDKCSPEQSINNFCYGPPLENTEPTDPADISVNELIEQPKSESGSCSNGYTGWQASSDCSKYYWCDNGMSGMQYDCGDGLLFDPVNEICTFSDEVDCASNYGNAGNTDTSSPTRRLTMPIPSKTTSPSSRPIATMGTLFPTISKEKVWPDTASPTNTPADPPWLSVTRKDENVAVRNSVVIYVLTQVSLLFFMIF